MMLQAFLSMVGFILVTSFIGFNIVLAYSKRGDFGFFELAGLSYLFGTAAISIEIFLFGIFKAKFITFNIITPWLILCIFNISQLRTKNRTSELPSFSFYKISLFEYIIAALLIFSISYAFFAALMRPVESYDAVAIWSLKAKILYLAHTMPKDFFVNPMVQAAHPDYPLLLPLSEVWFYTFIGSFNDYLVKVLFPLNFLAFLVIFYAFLKRAGVGRIYALIFTFMLSSIRQFNNYASNGYADLPMAVYASITFLALYFWIKEKNIAYFWTAFLSCIFSMWTKNEGVIVMLGMLLMVCINIFIQVKHEKRRLRSFNSVIIAAILLISFFAAWSLFKVSMNLHNDVVNAQALAGYKTINIFKRACAILYEYQRQAFGIKYWNFVWLAFTIFIWLGAKKIFSGEDKYIVMPLLFIWLCYTAVYFITPQDIEWQLRTTTSRLLLHILPLAVFYIALQIDRILNTPQ